MCCGGSFGCPGSLVCLGPWGMRMILWNDEKCRDWVLGWWLTMDFFFLRLYSLEISSYIYFPNGVVLKAGFGLAIRREWYYRICRDAFIASHPWNYDFSWVSLPKSTGHRADFCSTFMARFGKLGLDIFGLKRDPNLGFVIWYVSFDVLWSACAIPIGSCLP